MYNIQSPEFIRHLDGWLGLNKQTHADWLASNRPKIPPMFLKFDQPLYRGMQVDNDFMKKLEKGISLHQHASFSKDQKVGNAFIKDDRFRMRNAKNLTSILIKKKVPTASIILDIHAYCLFLGEGALSVAGMDEMSYDSAVKESEVLVRKGLKITMKDVTIIS